jgi:hypothetical protein
MPELAPLGQIGCLKRVLPSALEMLYFLRFVSVKACP